MTFRRWLLISGGILASAMAVPIPASSTNPPHIDYMLHCMGCHMEDGRGTGDMVPELKNFVGNFLGVDGGREFLIQVPGVAQAALDDEDLADLMNWLLREFSASQIPSGFEPYTPAEVGALRKSKLIDVAIRRATLVEQMKDVSIQPTLESPSGLTEGNVVR